MSAFLAAIAIAVVVASCATTGPVPACKDVVACGILWRAAYHIDRPGH